ncbi:hypothetical protein ACLOJK_016339 [Asimina triloba]
MVRRWPRECRPERRTVTNVSREVGLTKSTAPLEISAISGNRSPTQPKLPFPNWAAVPTEYYCGKRWPTRTEESDAIHIRSPNAQRQASKQAHTYMHASHACHPLAPYKYHKLQNNKEPSPSSASFFHCSGSDPRSYEARLEKRGVRHAPSIPRLLCQRELQRLQTMIIRKSWDLGCGCDASLLLDDTPNMLGEKLALSNINSLRSFEVIDEVKQALEQACPGVVSCADIIIMAARDAVVLVRPSSPSAIGAWETTLHSGGPSWEVKLGRKDSLTASQEDSNEIMPSPRANAISLINLFSSLNLSITDLVALSGSHSIGDGRCFSIVFRLYNQSGSGRPDPNMDPEFQAKLDQLCPQGADGNVTGGLDSTPRVFDNQYFKDLVSLRGFLNSDQTLFSGDARTREVVRRFSRSQSAFFSAFVEGMVKMGDLQSGRPGEIRKDCRVVNDPVSSGRLLVRDLKDRRMQTVARADAWEVEGACVRSRGPEPKARGIPIEIASLSKLKMLYLSSNNLTGRIPASLGNLASFAQLRLSKNNLDGNIPDELGRLANLQAVVHSSVNNLSGMLPTSIWNISTFNG